MNQVIDFSTLSWVKNELDETLKEARQALEAHVENKNDQAQLSFLSAHLHQVYGTLQMVELYGASLLAEEMEYVAKAIAENTVSKQEDACEVLMRAILQLPDYLERLTVGYRDIPLVLLPILNDLRAVRGENLLSDNAMFSPNLHAVLPDSVSSKKTIVDVSAQAKELRHRYQLGLLGWIKDKDVKNSLVAMGEVLQVLQNGAGKDQVTRLWWVARGVLSALDNGCLDSCVAVKRLYGQVDREIKRLIDKGEKELEKNPALDLIRNLLFYAARSKDKGDLISEIRSTYKLGELLPSEEEVVAARESMSGHNADLFATVSGAVKEELGRLKDAFDIVLRSEDRTLEEFSPYIESLSSLGDTLGMLSLDAPRKAVISKANDLRNHCESGTVPPETLLMDVASTLLFVESSVDQLGARPRDEQSDEVDINSEMARTEYDHVMEVVLQEAINDLIRGKEAIVSYAESDRDISTLETVPQLFNQVKGGLLLLGETRAAALIGSTSKYIERELINGQNQASQQDLDFLADSICGLEYYLEGKKEHRIFGASAMNVAEQGVDRLGYPSEAHDIPVNETGDIEAADMPGIDSTDDLAAVAVQDKTYREAIGDGEILEARERPEEDGDAKSGNQGVEDAGFNGMPDSSITFDSGGSEQGGSDLSESPELNLADSVVDEGPGLIPSDDEFDVPEVMELESDQKVEENTTQLDSEHEDNREFVESIAQDEESVSDGINGLGANVDAEEDADFAALDIIGTEIDEEILEIFLEEAEEEIASINDRLPSWIADENDSDALASVRRSYHTLKGSGRLVGAMRIGEFAWAYENMLNRLIDRSIAVTPELVQLLEAAQYVLPELVQQIKSGAPITRPVARLMYSAEALSKGEPLPATPVTGSAVNAGDDRAVSGDAADGMTLSVEEPVDIGISTMPDQGDEENLSQGGPSVDDMAPDKEEESVGAYDDTNVMDAMLYEIFNAESQGHLEVIRKYLNRVASSDSSVDEVLARALHTLHGSAHMANAGSIADLSGELEKYVKSLFVASLPMPDEGCEFLQESVILIDHMLGTLPEKADRPERIDEVISGVRKLRELVPLPSANEVGDSLVVEVAANDVQVDTSGEAVQPDDEDRVEPEDGSYDTCDEELVEIFLEESEQNLLDCEEALQRWQRSNEDIDATASLQRALHTIKGGARMADLPVVGDLVHAMETTVEKILDASNVLDKDAFELLQHAHDHLEVMLGRVRNRQCVEEVPELLKDLLSFQAAASVSEGEPDQGRAVALNEEEDSAAFQVEEETGASTGGDQYVDIDPELLEVFLEEAGDILEHSEETLRAWQDDPDNTGYITELQRELHTLKGGARMADITEIGDIAHAVESIMVRISDGNLAVNEYIFGALHQAQDALSEMLDRVRRREPVVQSHELAASLEAILEDNTPYVMSQDTEVLAREHSVESTEDEGTASGQVVGAKENEVVDRRAKERRNQELVRVKSELLDNMVNNAGEVSIYRSRLEQKVGAYRFNLIEMEQTVSRLRDQLRKLEIETEAQVLYRYETENQSMEEQFDPLEMDRYSHMQQLSRSLVESVSDLGSIQNLMENLTSESETLLLQQSRVNTELQEGLMRTRMVPFLGLAPRMRRIVRQTCQALGKKAELELSGAEGEMDRTVVDRIIAPIEHMLRNAISHGIEDPNQRKLAGKPETGTIRITLERESSDVVLKLADDGAGIGLAAIREKAIERGLLARDATITDAETLQFILETGFSTAEKVTQVAGRGVGMDVVNSEVKQLGGSLQIMSTEGEGTTFVVRLPFTLALNQALLIEVGEDTYAVPLSSIEGIVRMRRDELKGYYEDRESRFSYGGYDYEVCHLGSLLGTSQPRQDSGPKREPLLLSRVGEHCVAFQVENLLGSREIVVKSVGPQISTVRGVSGATILGDGRVVMILDLPALLRGRIANPMAEVEAIMNRPAASKGLTVMVVDDSITVRKVTARLLERNEMNVISAKDGVDAVSKLQENIPDIMLLDIEMPRMDGFELATHVRNEPRLRDIPIIMITSRTGDKHRQRAMQIGVNRYLGKPFQESELLENIRTLLAERD